MRIRLSQVMSRPIAQLLASLSLLAVLPGPALAAELQVTVDIPRLQVAEYHQPYTAIWIEQGRRDAVANLAVWYDVDLPDGEGKEWLKDMRQWWRRSGRSLELPIDGITGATRGPGSHRLTFSSGEAPLPQLPAGEYTLVVEAAREVGGREMLSIPFQWPPQKQQSLSTEGASELSKVSLEMKP